MKQLISCAQGAIFILLLGACVPLGQSEYLACSTSSGQAVNVREVYGTWKKIGGYDDVRSAQDLEENFDVLVVQTGGAMCQVEFSSREPIATIYQAAYTHDPNTNTLDLNTIFPQGGGDFEATYSFSGGCGNPQMTLRYDNGATETYEFRSKSVGDGCI